MKEIWKPIAGYEGYYEVSNLGRVKSLDRTILQKDRKNKTITERILKQDDCRRYQRVRLYAHGKGKKFQTHRLVAQAFLPNPQGLPQVNHKNGIKSDNRVSNLEWCNGSENIKHAFHTGLLKAKKGAEHIEAKFTWEQVEEIRRLYKPYNKEHGAHGLARKYGVNYNTIWLIVTNKTYKE